MSADDVEEKMRDGLHAMADRLSPESTALELASIYATAMGLRARASGLRCMQVALDAAEAFELAADHLERLFEDGLASLQVEGHLEGLGEFLYQTRRARGEVHDG